MRKKITLVSISAALIAVLVAGMSLAYFTDTDSKDNVFTMGNVDITLNEDFDQNNAKLLPGSQSSNTVKKEVTITNNQGSEDAYVWYEWLIPQALDSTDGSTGTNNVVHVNSYGSTWDAWRTDSRFWGEGQTAALDEDKTWDHDPDQEVAALSGPEGFVGTETIDGVVYNKYLVLYHGKLAAGETTSPAMKQVYLDKNVDTKTENGKTVYTINGNTINFDFSNGFHIFVRAYGIQANGFDDVYKAYSAYTAQQK